MDTYPTEDELNKMKNKNLLGGYHIGNENIGYPLDGMVRGIGPCGHTRLHYFGITSKGYVLNGITYEQIQRYLHSTSHKQKTQPLTKEYIDIVKCIMSPGNIKIFDSQDSNYRFLMKWADELMDIFRKYHTDNYNNVNKNNKDDENKNCVICMTSKRTHIFINCGHFCICEDCDKILNVNNIKKCPLCNNKSITHRVYF